MRIFAIAASFILVTTMFACGRSMVTPSPIVFFKPVSTSTPMPTATPLTFIYYSQRDPLWSEIVLTCSNRHKSTFLHQGCGETSFAMLMSTFVDPKYTPATVLNDFYGYTYCTGTDSSYSAELLREQGFTVLGVYTDIAEVKEYVRTGWFAWMHVEYYENSKRIGHEVIVIGVDENNNFLVTDPFYGVGSVGDSQFPYTESNIIGFYIVKPPAKQTINP